MESEQAMAAERPRVLIMEDEEVIRELLSDFLSSQGYEVELVSSGEEGVLRFQSHPFSVVIADYGLPGINGIDACRRIAALGTRSRHVIITGWGSLEAAEREPCIDRVLAKPFDLMNVLAMMRELAPLS